MPPAFVKVEYTFELQEVADNDHLVQTATIFQNMYPTKENDSSISELKAGNSSRYKFLRPEPSNGLVRMFVFRMYCLVSGQLQISMDYGFNNASKDKLNSRVINIDCVEKEEFKGIVRVNGKAPIGIKLINRSFGSMRLATVDVTVPQDMREDIVLKAELRDSLSLRDQSGKYYVNNKRSTNLKPILLPIFLFLLIGCIARIYQARRQRLYRLREQEDRLDQTQLETLENAAPNDADNPFGRDSRIDPNKYNQVVVKRRAGDNYGPWGEKK